MADSLKTKTLKGLGWSAFERFSVQGVTFILQIVLARLLCPADYGIIGMLAIFMQIAQVFIDCGFTQALIQRKDCNQIDCSTVFYYNLFVSITIYLVFFVSAPFIAGFYDIVELSSVLRVIALNLVISSLVSVHRTKLTKDVDFKLQSKITFFSTVLSGGIGVTIAYYGGGVWALVLQTLSNSTIQLFLFFYKVKWIPSLVFSIQSFKSLFGYGSKLLAANLINVVYKNLYTLIIGKRFTATDVGNYTRAEQFALFPSSNLSNIIVRVIFPVLSKMQDDNDRLTRTYRKAICYSSFLIFPLMLGLVASAKPFVISVLSERWEGAIAILQILCLDWMLDHISAINLNLLLVKGRTDLALKLEGIKKTIAFSILFISLFFGIFGMCWGEFFIL